MKSILAPVLLLALLPLSPLRADEDTSLGEQMEILNDAYKAFRRTDDAAEGAKLAREAQDSVLKAIPMAPQMVEKGGHPEGKEAAMADYRKHMGELFVTLCKVEQAFLANDFDKVQELVPDLKASKKEGHNEFMEEE